jgi:hypothetical protein
MKTEAQRTCPSCGNEFSGAMQFFPVCMLRKGLAGGVASGESSFEEAAKPTPVQALQCFEHYELVAGEDGKPVELGRGAMGVTYKAFDVDLRCPVTPKVISKKHLSDESARRRFSTRSPCGNTPFGLVEIRARKRLAGAARPFNLGRVEL